MGALPQESWVMIVKGLMVKPIDEYWRGGKMIPGIDPELFMPLDERKGGHVRKHKQARTPWATDRISVCGMCGEYLVLDDNGHVCGERKISEEPEWKFRNAGNKNLFNKTGRDNHNG